MKNSLPEQPSNVTIAGSLSIKLTPEAKQFLSQPTNFIVLPGAEVNIGGRAIQNTAPHAVTLTSNYLSQQLNEVARESGVDLSGDLEENYDA
jgi:hypothetical protein